MHDMQFIWLFLLCYLIFQGIYNLWTYCKYQSNNTFEILKFFIIITPKWITSFNDPKYKMKIKSKTLRSKADEDQSIRWSFPVSLEIWASNLWFSSAYLVETFFQSPESRSEEMESD